jgi:hypothetical protein
MIANMLFRITGAQERFTLMAFGDESRLQKRADIRVVIDDYDPQTAHTSTCPFVGLNFESGRRMSRQSHSSKF